MEIWQKSRQQTKQKMDNLTNLAKRLKVGKFGKLKNKGGNGPSKSLISINRFSSLGKNKLKSDKAFKSFIKKDNQALTKAKPFKYTFKRDKSKDTVKNDVNASAVSKHPSISEGLS